MNRDYFSYHNHELHCEGISLKNLAEKYGTPLYVYSYQALFDRFKEYDEAFKGVNHLICYSVKANSNGAILRAFIKMGGGMDVVTGGELYRALKAGCDPQKIVFSGVGKSAEEIEGALKAGILQFNVESEGELELLSQRASQLKKKAPVAMRVNPDVDPKTHPYIATGLKESKFGIAVERAKGLYHKASKMDSLQVVGIDCHIGSQITTVEPFAEAALRVKELVLDLGKAGLQIKQWDVGGGLGIRYRDETPPSAQEYAKALLAVLGPIKAKLIFEPGRYLVGNSGALITRVLYDKMGETKRFVVVDAASNDMMRPSLYGAHHEINPIDEQARGRQKNKVDVVGPICETGDFLAKDRSLPESHPGEFLAIMSAGAYGQSMASSYNSRPKVAEIMVCGSESFLIQARGTYEDLIKGEKVPEFLLNS